MRAVRRLRKQKRPSSSYALGRSGQVWQGQIEATVVTSTVAAATVKAGKYKDLLMGGDAPYDIDHVGLIALRQEYGLINYLNLFVNQQVRTGRAQELNAKWIGGTLPELTIKGVYR